MTLNFPDSPSTGDIYTDSTSGFQYEWNGTVWISTDPQRAANIKELDDISSGFNGSTTQFNLRVSSSAVEPVSDAQILISVGGVMQNPTNDYTVSGSTITFTTAPSAGLTFFGVFLGQALSLNTIQDGTVEFASFKTGTAGVGIQSAGSQIGVGITNLNFIGTGNTFVAIGNTVNVSVNVGGIDTTGTSYFNNITASGNINVTGDLTYDEVTAVNQKISGVTTTTGLDVLGISSVKDLRSVGVTTLTTGSATNFTVTNLVGTGVTATNLNTTNATITGIATVTGIIDGNGGANISGGSGLVASTAKVSDLTSGRVTYAGSSGELQDNAGLTFDGTTLAATRLAAPVAFTTSLTAANVDVTGITTIRDDLTLKGASANITFDKSTDDLIFDDNAQAIFGTGGDLSIYHDSTHSYITNTTGDLKITDASAMILASNSFRIKNAASDETYIAADANSDVAIYYDNAKKIETTSVGVNVTGNVDCDSINNAGISTFTGDVALGGHISLGDSKILKLGAGTDAQLTHTGSYGSFNVGTGYMINDIAGDWYVRNSAGSESRIIARNNSGVELYTDGTKRVETTTVGMNVVGNVDCDSFNNAGISTFRDDATFIGASNNAMWNETNSAFELNDSVKIKMGSGADMSIYHDGSHNKIECANGQMHIKASQVDFINAAGSEYMLRASQDGAVTLYHDNSAKLATASGGVTVTGTVAATSYTGDGSNLTGVGSSLAIWQANPAVYSSDQEMTSTVVGLAYTYSNKLTAGSGSITLRETNSSGTTVQTWSTSQVTIDGNQFTADALSADLKSNQLYHITIPAGFFTDPNGTNSVGVAYTFNTKEQIWHLFTWGRGSVPGSGGLGQNDQTDRSSPKQVPGTKWSAVSQGSNTGHFLASRNDSTLWAWGQNAWGQLGLTNRSYKSSPEQIPGTTWAVGVEKIAKGTFLSLAIKTDGTLWTWGRNEFGQLGLSNLTNYSSPKQVPGTTWRSVWTSHYSSYATKTDGTLWSWGENTRGKLGQNNNTQYSSPRQIPGTTWNDGMGGDTAAGCTRTDGTLWVWGDDDDGTLGLGQRDQHKSSPYQLPGSWGAIAGAYRCFWASKTNGTLWSWGQNETEQLGLGIPDNNKRSSPVQIGSDTTWRYARKDLAGGQRGGFAIKTDNTMWGWGRGGYGVLGNNAANDHDSPIQVLGSKWRQVAKGRESAAGIQDTELS